VGFIIEHKELLHFFPVIPGGYHWGRKLKRTGILEAPFSKIQENNTKKRGCILKNKN
jgi:hypothetical protein